MILGTRDLALWKSILPHALTFYLITIKSGTYKYNSIVLYHLPIRYPLKSTENNIEKSQPQVRFAGSIDFFIWHLKHVQYLLKMHYYVTG